MDSQKRLILSLALAAVMAILASPALAITSSDGDPPLMGPGEYFQRWWHIAQADLIVGMERGTCSIVWTFDRLALLTYDKIVQEGVTRDVREAMLDAVANLMPDVLRNLFFGASGGVGLMYLALILAGLVMIAVPLFGGGGVTMIRLDRVLTWGVLITALFISTGLGYDFIGLVEDVRVGMMDSVAQNSTTSLKRLVTDPMMARPDEVLVTIFNFVLPDKFEKTYFPEPVTQIYRVVLVDVKLGSMAEDTPVETEASIERRKVQAAAGIVMALFSALGAVLIFMFALIHALLDLAALVTLLFLFAALPLGFFDFGIYVLSDTLNRYVQIAVVGLVVAIFMAIAAILLDRIMTNINDPRTFSIAALYIFLAITILKAAFSRAFALLREAGGGVASSTKAVIGTTATGSGVFAVTGMAGVLASSSTSSATSQGSKKAMVERAIGAAAVGATRGFFSGGGYAGAAKGALKSTAHAIKDETQKKRRGNVFVNNGRGLL